MTLVFAGLGKAASDELHARGGTEIAADALELLARAIVELTAAVKELREQVRILDAFDARIEEVIRRDHEL